MRILLHETMDPDGAMYRWLSSDAATMGHAVLPFPSQEALPLLGPDGLRAAFIAVAQAFKPTLVIVNPPYDQLDLATIETLRGFGAKVVAFAFDESLFADARRRPAVAVAVKNARAAFDRYATTDLATALALAQDGVPAKRVRFAASVEPFQEFGEIPVAVNDRVVVVGRRYDKRLALVNTLAAHVPVEVFGHGWDPAELAPGARAHGPITRPVMNAVHRDAGVVLTTGDWENVTIPMVKYRLLEVAFVGGVQVAQASADLTSYFRPAEVPAFSDPASLVDVVRAVLSRPSVRAQLAKKAYVRALAEHRWQSRLAELVDGLDVPAGEGGDDAPPAWCALVAMVAHDAERRGATRLADALYATWHERRPNATAAAGLARSALLSRRAPPLYPPSGLGPGTSVGLYATLPTPVIGLGLGQVGYLDPTPERLAAQLAALAEAGQTATAWKVLESAYFHDPDLVIAVAAILEPTGPAEAQPLWAALFRKALVAAPTQSPSVQERHRARWAEHARAHPVPLSPRDAAAKKGPSSPISRRY